MIAWYFALIIGIVTLIAGLVVGFIITKKLFEKQLKKNPPINEKMIKAMFMSMGRTPSEKQIRQVMRSMEEAKNS